MTTILITNIPRGTPVSVISGLWPLATRSQITVALGSGGTTATVVANLLENETTAGITALKAAQIGGVSLSVALANVSTQIGPTRSSSPRPLPPPPTTTQQQRPPTPTATIYISNLDTNTSSSAISTFVRANYGALRDQNIQMYDNPKYCKLIAALLPAEATDLVNKLNGLKLEGATLSVSQSSPV